MSLKVSTYKSQSPLFQTYKDYKKKKGSTSVSPLSRYVASRRSSSRIRRICVLDNIFYDDDCERHSRLHKEVTNST